MADSMTNDFNYTAVDIYSFFSFDWWLHHLAAAYRDNPQHMVTELALIILVLWLVFKRDQRKKPSDFDNLSHREQEELIKDWQPEPLVPPSLANSKHVKAQTSIHLNTGVGAVVTDNENNEYIHLSSCDYLGMAKNEKILSAAEQTIKKYAVGSCGPRGFYGTMDIHLNLERTLSEYFGNPAIIYADYVGCPASVITAFAKRGDLLLIDEGCHYLITQGAILSRSNVIWFEHNNMNALETCLQTVNEEDTKSNRPLNRRFIITEGVFSNFGDICKLNKIIELKEAYKYRLILDDSHGIGSIHPKGTPGFYNIAHDKIDMYFAGMDTALGSTGGFCVGNKESINHQTLSGAGYVFSASSPPFQCTAAQIALEQLMENGEEFVREIKANAVLMRKLLEDGEQRWEMGWNNMECPLIHLRFVDKWIDDASAESIFEIIASEARNKGVLVYASVYLPQEFGISDKADPRPSLRIVVTRMHTKEQLEKCANVVKALLLDAVEKRNGYKMDGMDDLLDVDEEKQEE